jgi:hypothetical protein
MREGCGRPPAAYHDRMPMALEDGQFDDWIRGLPELAGSIMSPYAGRDRSVAGRRRGRQREIRRVPCRQAVIGYGLLKGLNGGAEW